MNHGPLLFLAAFLALGGSWFGMVLLPQAQLGQLQPTNTVPPSVSYPAARAGLAQQGLQVYRAQGCAYCHSQQVRQTGTECQVVLNELGTNQTAVVKALIKTRAGTSEDEAHKLINGLPKTISQGATRSSAEAQVKALRVAGAKADLWVVPVGPDIARGYGKRRTVAEDFLFDSPVMLGSARIGPDLANVGARLSDPAWHLRHLYAPATEVKGSLMPSYRYLFEIRKIVRTPSPDALKFPGDHPQIPFDCEVVPRPEAKALVAYLTSLRIEAPLFQGPLTVPFVPVQTAATNSGAPTNSSAK